MKKGGKGFPYLVMMDAQGEVILAHNGARTVAGFEKFAADVARYVKAKPGSVEALLLEMDYSKIKVEEGEAQLKGLELTDEQKKALESIKLGAEVMDMVKKAGRDRAKQLGAGKTFLERHKAAKSPSSYWPRLYFYLFLLDCAEDQKDAASFGEGLEALKTLLEGSADSKKLLDEKAQILKRLKEGGK
jgi:hypothetical protein